ncbi:MULTISPECIES: YjgN family protein [Sphingobium]|uniref:YjgN family protein n=1 Tax=Sphingobium tyrosinilyticum TaxID=2715436 RepID=A0ABV9EV82_9SPHN|nr:YjgN family protein [Sphingobium sp. EP60837]ANI77516.1 Inner membrane protein YjgN [Sphingobium sp. EP60837]
MDQERFYGDSFAFEGSWREYAPIAFTNLLLTIVTLGIYRFWATTRTRCYLWANTRFIDDRLEWTGTGKELFLGFLMVVAMVGVPFLILQFSAQALILQGHGGVAAILTLAAFGGIFYMVGVARFRALRYRLSRTWWHGIRGGSDDQGFGYGVSYMWKSAVGSLALGLLIPWSMMSLWNERWNKMSFGPHLFEAAGDHGPAFKRFLLFYLFPIALVVVGGIIATMAIPFGDMQNAGGAAVAGILAIIGLVFALYLGMGLIALAFYAKFFRQAVEGLSLAGLNFQFCARTKDWLLLFLGDIALVTCTLGVGSIFLQYRHWKFFVAHMGATGEIYTDELTQSQTKTSRHGEGLLDALDVGAF